MDTSYLAQQVTTIIGQLHALFDDIGVPSHERDSREAELFSALSATLHGQLQQVTEEKHALADEAQGLIDAIKQMQASLDDGKPSPRSKSRDDLQVSYPLTRCVRALNDKYATVSKLHRERFEHVRKLAEALESYASHLESDFVAIQLPPTAPDAEISPSFDVSSAYVAKLDNEFTRVYEEYHRRLNTVKAVAQEIIQLWAELGTPQAQTDSTIVEYHRDAPEQLGLHEEDIAQLKEKKDHLEEEKSSRERRLAQLRATIEELWERLSVEHHERKRFLNSNRGCGMRTINEYEDELSRLNELKRQNLHLFVEEARITLQELWDALYFSEEEMLDFTPAFSDVCSDALLSAHEAEIARLEALKEQRLPVLSKIDRHRELIKERNDLQQSSQDASRLMARGNKGEKRDPGKLLREEKMRKRIQKELPKVEQDLKITLEAYEDEYGRPFLVHGERYLDELNAATSRGPPPRAKTPSNLNMPTRQAAPPKSTPSSRPRSGTIHGQSSFSQTTNGPPPSRAKTPVSATFGGSISRNPFAQSVSAASGSKSPSKIPARTGPPRTLGSPERRAPTLSRTDSTLSRADSMHSRGDSILSRGDSILSRADSMHSRPNSTLSRADSMHSRGYSTLSRADSLHSRADSLHSRANSTLSRADSMHSRADSTYSRPESSHSTTVRRMGPPIVPPARMKDLFVPPEPSEMPKHRFEFKNSDRSESLVRNTPLEDAYEGSYNPLSQTMRPSYAAAFVETPSLSSNSSRHLSTASSVGSGATAQSCSENWETFSEQSDEAPESDVDFQYHRNSQPRQYTPEGGLSSTPRAIQGKKVRGIRSVDGPSSVMEQANRTIRLHDSSEAAWTDDGETY